MALEYSTALRNFLQCFGSKKQALTGGVFDIYSGDAPASPDDAATGTKLCRVTLSSGAWTSEVLASGTVTLSGSAGSVTALTVNSVSVMTNTVTYTTDLTTTAALLATEINSTISSPRYMASSSGAVVTIKAMPGTGTGPNTYVVSTTAGGGLSAVDVNLSGGVASINGLTFGNSVLGVLQDTGTWSGVILASGTAGYFRITGSRADAGGADAAPWVQIRMQGTCGTTSGADYNMGNTSMVVGRTHTIDSWVETLSE